MRAQVHNGLELRAAVELRAAGRQLVGYAATFRTEARIGSFREVILPGAFRASLASGQDILALVDHDTSKLLARTSSGTLRLQEDGKGLAFEVDVPDTQLGRDVLALAERRDLGGMSFGFTVPTGGEAWPAQDRRELRAVQLAEISAIHSWPAYPATSISARSRAAGDAARERRRFYARTL